MGNRIRALIVSVLLTGCAAAQTGSQAPVSGLRQKLAFIIPDLYGPEGLTLPNPDHEAHFDSAFQSNFGPFNIAIGSQLSSLPIPSPASGFTYTFDPALGTSTRSANSFGPILGERAETIGKGRFYFGFSYQHFQFDSLDGQALRNVPSVFEHLQTTADPEIKKDIITTENFLDIQLSQTITYVTYGVHNRLDVSVAFPYVTAKLDVVSNATIQRIGTGTRTDIHYFRDSNGNVTNRRQFASAGTASGPGDVQVRLKGTAWKAKPASIALGVDVRLPTGDEFDLLGSGALGVRPFAVISGRVGKVTPHLNAGYQWNDSSVLAGDIRSGRRGHLPNQFTWAAGFDAGLDQRFTVAFDLLGQRIFNSARVDRSAFTAANGAVFPSIAFSRRDANLTAGALGFKVNPVGTLLVAFNVTFQMNDPGLRDRVTPLIGVSYTF